MEDTIREESYVPKIQVSLPVSLHVNGTQIPPIDVEGEITGCSLACLAVRCDHKIPIPSKGVVCFSPGEKQENVILDVDVVQRLERNGTLWPWKRRPKYELQLFIRPNPKSVRDRYLRFVYTHIC